MIHCQVQELKLVGLKDDKRRDTTEARLRHKQNVMLFGNDGDHFY